MFKEKLLSTFSQTKRKKRTGWQANSCCSNPDRPRAINSIWNVTVVYRLRRFRDGNFTTQRHPLLTSAPDGDAASVV